MKATGIVRRIDDLGRIVIPKEIRRTMRIREGDPLQNTLIQSEALAIALDKTVGGEVKSFYIALLENFSEIG